MRVKRRPLPSSRRRKKKVPTSAYRRAHAPQPPRAVEHFFAIAMIRVAKRFAAIVRKHVTSAAIAKIVKPVENTDTKRRFDAPEDDELEQEAAEAVDNIVSALRVEARPEKTRGPVKAVARKAADRTLAHSKSEFKRFGIGVPKEPETDDLIADWIKDNVERIEDMQASEIDTIADILHEGYGRRAESIADDIEERLNVTHRRAENIARQSVLNLNGQITHERQVAAGIEKYIWTTSHDERVRPEHRELDGKEFSWEEGGDPDEGNPGDAYNCRCIPFPILPELEEEAPEAGPEGEEEAAAAE